LVWENPIIPRFGGVFQEYEKVAEVFLIADSFRKSIFEEIRLTTFCTEWEGHLVTEEEMSGVK